jgi:hypothetical protein
MKRQLLSPFSNYTNYRARSRFIVHNLDLVDRLGCSGAGYWIIARVSFFLHGVLSCSFLVRWSGLSEPPRNLPRSGAGQNKPPFPGHVVAYALSPAPRYLSWDWPEPEARVTSISPGPDCKCMAAWMGARTSARLTRGYGCFPGTRSEELICAAKGPGTLSSVQPEEGAPRRLVTGPAMFWNIRH